VAAVDIERVVAIHEAGHAVAAVRAGLVFDTVSALPDETRQLDGALYWSELQDSGQLAMPAELLAVVLLAGPCAEARERKLRFDRMFEGVGASDDRESMATLGLSQAQFLAAGREALALVDQDWSVIEKVAAELMVVERLTFEDVEDIIAGTEAVDRAGE
jgi:hypothetical protein